MLEGSGIFFEDHRSFQAYCSQRERQLFGDFSNVQIDGFTLDQTTHKLGWKVVVKIASECSS